MGQSSSQALFEEINIDGISDDVVDQINDLWKKFDKGNGTMDKKTAHKFLGALYVFLLTRGDINKEICNIKKKEIVAKWFIYFDKSMFSFKDRQKLTSISYFLLDGDGMLSKQEFLFALHSMLSNFQSTTLDIVATCITLLPYLFNNEII